jgi:hypothetical protein
VTFETAFPPRRTGLTEVVGSYATRAEAEARAGSLRRERDRPGRVVVAARGLRGVDPDELAPPLTVTVALGAASSAIGAALVVGLFGALDPTISLFGVLALAFYALVFGAAGGAVIGALLHVGRARHAASLPQVEAFAAECFDVLVEHPADRSRSRRVSERPSAQ